jgi:hypothetical protein
MPLEPSIPREAALSGTTQPYAAQRHDAESHQRRKDRALAEPSAEKAADRGADAGARLCTIVSKGSRSRPEADRRKTDARLGIRTALSSRPRWWRQREQFAEQKWAAGSLIRPFL